MRVPCDILDRASVLVPTAKRALLVPLLFLVAWESFFNTKCKETVKVYG